MFVRSFRWFVTDSHSNSSNDNNAVKVQATIRLRIGNELYSMVFRTVKDRELQSPLLCVSMWFTMMVLVMMSLMRPLSDPAGFRPTWQRSGDCKPKDSLLAASYMADAPREEFNRLVQHFNDVQAQS